MAGDHRYAQFRFVLSPCAGQEASDCADVWDALYMGAIPIVRRGGCPADRLWDELPVLVVSSWDEVSPSCTHAHTRPQLHTSSLNLSAICVLYLCLYHLTACVLWSKYFIYVLSPNPGLPPRQPCPPIFFFLVEPALCWGSRCVRSLWLCAHSFGHHVQIDAALLERTWSEYSTRRFELDRLRMAWYADMIRAAAKCTK